MPPPLSPPFPDPPATLATVGYLPLLIGDLAVVSHAYGEIVAYHAATLAERWRFPLKSPYQRSLPYRGAVVWDGAHLLVNDDAELAVLDLHSGRPQGRYRIPDFDLVNGVPCPQGLITPSYRDRKFTVGLYPAGDYDHPVWTVPTSAPARPLSASESVCVFPRTKSDLVCVSLPSGHERWAFSVASLGAWTDPAGSNLAGSFAGAPILTAGLAIVPVTGRRVVAIALDSGHLAWQCAVDVLTPSNLTFDGQRTLHLLGHPTYYQIAADTGQITAQIDVKTELEAIGVTLVNHADLSQTHLFATGASGPLFALDLATGRLAWTYPLNGQPAATFYPIASPTHLWCLAPSSTLLRFSLTS